MDEKNQEDLRLHARYRDLCDRPLDELRLSDEAIRKLARTGVTTIGHCVDMQINALAGYYPGRFPWATWVEITQKLVSRGYWPEDVLRKTLAADLTFDKTGETISARPYQSMDDFMRIRTFLMDTYRLNRSFHNWTVRRLEGSRFWGDPAWGEAWAKNVQLWENEAGELVGAAHVSGQGVFLQIHPYYRHIEDDMMAWAEENVAEPDKDGQPHAWLEVYDYDLLRQEMLTRRGYQKTEDYGYLRWWVPGAIPEVAFPEGYTIRSLRPGSMDDCGRWAEVVGAVFAHANPTAEHIANFQKSPSYRHDLHLVAEAEDGSFAAFAGLTFDDQNRVAEFEPVGTHPDHRQKGLGKAVMAEGLRRLEKLDVDMVYVFTGDMIPANALYESMGFTGYHMNHTWKKRL